MGWSAKNIILASALSLLTMYIGYRIQSVRTDFQAQLALTT